MEKDLESIPTIDLLSSNKEESTKNLPKTVPNQSITTVHGECGTTLSGNSKCVEDHLKRNKWEIKARHLGDELISPKILKK